MVSITALLAGAPLLFLPQVWAWSIIQNTATGYVFDDWDFQSLDYGGIIDGFTFWPPIAIYQVWTLTKINGSYFKFSTVRTFAPSPVPIEVHVDGLPGAGLTAQKYGSLFKYVNPYGGGSIYAFIFALEEIQLAITAPDSSGDQLTLQPYNASDTMQHWVFYDAVPGPSAAVLSSPIPIPLSDENPGSPASAAAIRLFSSHPRPTVNKLVGTGTEPERLALR
ncbi:hypothetical protein AURDEDRAFT_174611 [Auricularia subglabra TFB-10046 SS5]|uniref:Ricin B lectin domain-containing protein n=1 Tax=Auricularia subglabra (strain TFB-10046 / SS5) TaxID=717982 RepID=J0WSU4_AURST|nr:hypothetical protein AURDEDRAFT_174611 [Auricularia subglabra TFB-10046 SS5]